MPVARPSQWSSLFDIAGSIIDQAQRAAYPFEWTFGGGTALMLQIDHRESHDIDLFLDDPQVLPFLNPGTQGYALDRAPDGYDTDGSHVLKLTFGEVGEIDFICCASITERSANRVAVRGREVLLETASRHSNLFNHLVAQTHRRVYTHVKDATDLALGNYRDCNDGVQAFVLNLLVVLVGDDIRACVVGNTHRAARSDDPSTYTGT